MAKKPKKLKSGFNLNDLLDYLGSVTGKKQASGYANYGSKANAAVTKAVKQGAASTARTSDLFVTGGLGGLGYDLATGKPMSKKQIAGTAAYTGLNLVPMGKLAKLGGPTYKTVRSATETAKQLRLLNMLLGGE